MKSVRAASPRRPRISTRWGVSAQLTSFSTVPPPAVRIALACTQSITFVWTSFFHARKRVMRMDGVLTSTFTTSVPRFSLKSFCTFQLGLTNEPSVVG